MAKAAGKPAPQKRSKSPSAKAKEALPKAQYKSNEIVVDSDSDEVPATSKSGKKETSKPAPAVKPKAEANVKVEKSVTPVAIKKESSSSESDSSDEESSSENELPALGKKVVAGTPANGGVPKVNGVKRTASEASSSSEESEGDSEEEKKVVGPAAKRSKTEVGTTKPKASVSKTHVSGTEENASGPLPAQPYNPPSGYVPLDLSGVTFSKAFLSSSLQGKQVWHITAPSDVSLASISEVALDAIASGKPVLNHKGTDYILSEADKTNTSTVAFAPSKDSFAPLEKPVNLTLQLQQHVTLPSLSHRQASQLTGSNAAASVAQASVTSVRPQPKGLRMRYRPPGYGTGDPGTLGSDSETAEAEETSRSFQFPRALGGSSELHDRSTTQEPNGPALKPKKKRKEKAKDAPTNEHTNGTSGEAEASKRDDATVVKSEEMDEDVKMADADMPLKPSKEDKARRKEEKRLKKEAKMKAKAV
ncbi:hypothetical protein LTR10_003148 [Elasticomyces elasticus]|nr:hypothetical protein LTR10_003148 [Elasticomyces elasticus]KAK4969420.1 hypothetical protein LTR42_008690 [Elasticomyces elasticus]